MRFGPALHGVLLVVALLVAYQTWTRSDSEPKDRGDFVVWQVPKDAIELVSFETPNQTVVVELRGDDNGGKYLWASVKKVEKAAKASNDAQSTTTTREFPVGEAGQEMMAEMAHVRALRKLGGLDAQKLEEYGLSAATKVLTVSVKGSGRRRLVIGARVYGGRALYAQDPETGESYVLSTSVTQLVEGEGSQLALKKLHSYEEEEVQEVKVTTQGQDQRLVRNKRKTEDGTTNIWVDPVEEGAGDAKAMANFVGRVGKLDPISFAPDLTERDLEHIATVRYLGKGGKILGFCELYRHLPVNQEAPRPNTKAIHTQYYVRSERTRVFAKVSRMAAERVDDDLVSLFGVSPAPEPIQPMNNSKP